MAYQKQTWKNRKVTYPHTYEMSENDNGTVNLIPHPGEVEEEGFALNAEHMNHMEEGIFKAHELVSQEETNRKNAITGLENSKASKTELTEGLKKKTDTGDFDELEKRVKAAEDQMDELADNEVIQEIRETGVGKLDFNNETRDMTVYDMDGNIMGTFVIEGGGGGTGGGGTDYFIRLVSGNRALSMAIPRGSKMILRATFYEYLGANQTEQDGILTVEYKAGSDNDWKVLKEARSIKQGVEFAEDVTDVLFENGATNIRFSVLGGESQKTRTLVYAITQVDAGVEAINFNSAAVYSGNISFNYRPTGRNLEKVMHFELDGVDETQDIGTTHNAQLNHTIDVSGLAYGAHSFRVWFSTPDGTTSNILNLVILYNNGQGSAPMIGAVLDESRINNGDPLTMSFVTYTPGQETTDQLTIRVYSMSGDEQVEHYKATLLNLPNNTMQLWQGISYPEQGTGYLELTSGSTVTLLEFAVSEFTASGDWPLTMVESNLCYEYSPAGRSNSDADRALYVHEWNANGTKTKVRGTFEGFNWVADGYVDGESLLLSGKARHTIELPILTTEYTDSDGQRIKIDSANDAKVTEAGRTVEIDFMMDNVTDDKATVLRCMTDGGVGFAVTPQVAYLLQPGASLTQDETGFVENEESVAVASMTTGERIRLAFVIEAVNKENKQSINLYVNGNYGKSLPYDEATTFLSNEFITMGTDACMMHLYNVRIYNRGLTTAEIRRNYLNSPLSVRERDYRQQFNDVLDDGGDVSYKKAVKRFATLLIISNLSKYKGDKQKCGLILRVPADNERGYEDRWVFVERDPEGKLVCENNVQGTTSAKFLIKNFKATPKKPTYAEDGSYSGAVKVKMPLKGKDAEGNNLSIPESTFCFKADYMSGDHANTTNAVMADTIYEEPVPPQEDNPLVQTTIWGFRCLLFNISEEDYEAGKEPIFYADGYLNNDKGNADSFGLKNKTDDGNVTKCQKWEFLNNTTAICHMQSDRLFAPVVNPETQETHYAVTDALESTYPDQGDLKDAGLTPEYAYIQILYTWIVQRANFWTASDEHRDNPLVYKGVSYYTEKEYRRAIFLAEFEKHFNLDHAMKYYAFCEAVALSDNWSKNMFLTCYDVTVENIAFTSVAAHSWRDTINWTTGEVNESLIDWDHSTFAIWYITLYDLDSGWGVENNSYLRIPYYADRQYQLRGGYQFNGYDNYFWHMVEDAMQDKIKAAFAYMADNDVFTYDAVKRVQIDEAGIVGLPALIDRDMEVKYDDPWKIGYLDYSEEPPVFTKTNMYKYMQRYRIYQKMAFAYKRFHMLYSKYQTKQFRNSNINFRAGANVAAENASITVQGVQVMYFGVKYSDTGTAITASGKVNAGVPQTIRAASGVGNSDTVYIYGAYDLTDVGDLSPFYPYEIQVGRAKLLKRLVIGSDTPGYANVKLDNVDVSENALLEIINLCNCTNITGTVDLSNNLMIREVYASGCGTSFVRLPNGGVLEKLHLGAVSSIVVLNQTAMQDFKLDSTENLKEIRIEGTPNVPALAIVGECLSSLNGLRLVDIDEDLGGNIDALSAIIGPSAQGKYMTNTGAISTNPLAWPTITGRVHVNSIGEYLLADLNERYPDLVIDYDSVVPQHLVEFFNDDGTLLDRQYVIQGQAAENPITREHNRIPIPTKADTEAEHFEYADWDQNFGSVASSMRIYATYTATVREYTVEWRSGNVLWDSKTVPYGTEAVSDKPHPQDTSREGNLVYRRFKGWDKSTGRVTSDMTGTRSVNAVFEEASLPTKASGKTLATMNTAELYGLIRYGVLSSNGGLNNDPTSSYYQMIQSGDPYNLRMGRDFDFVNVESEELVSLDSPMVFSGASYHDTGVKLFDEDKDWTLAIDFEWANTNNANGVLASCAHSGAGFNLAYSGGPSVSFINGNSVRVAETTSREICVIRHKKGDNSLYVYASNKNALAPIESTITRTLSMTHDANLVLGCFCDAADSYRDNYATATVHWCKVWFGDLGENVSRQVASWPRQLVPMRAEGLTPTNFRLHQKAGESTYANLFLGMTDCLDQSHRMNPTNDNAGGFTESEMNTWLNTRVLNGMPILVVDLMLTVQVLSTIGHKSTTQWTTANVKVLLRSAKEVGFEVNSAGYSGEAAGTINLYSTNTARIKRYKFGAGDAAAWWLRSPGTGYDTSFASVSNGGGIWTNSSASVAYGVSFGFNF